MNYTFRMHDLRVGRFFAVDPLFKSYPSNSPYAFSENRVIDSGELEGLERYWAADNKGNGKFIGQVGKSDEIRILSNVANHALIFQANNPKESLKNREKAAKTLEENSFHGYNSVDTAALKWAEGNIDKSKQLGKELMNTIYKIKISDKRIHGITDGSGFVAINGLTVMGTEKDKDGTMTVDQNDAIDANKNTPGRLSAFNHTHIGNDDFFSGFEGDAGISSDYKIPIYLVNNKFQLRVFDDKTMGAGEGGNFRGELLYSEIPKFRWDMKTQTLSKKREMPTTRSERTSERATRQ